MTKPDFSKLRDDFPMLRATMHGQPLIYLDSAATAQKPQIVIDTISDFYQNHYGTVHRAIYELSSFSTQAYEDVRRKVKAFINAHGHEEIIFTRGTTDAINTAAWSFGKEFIKPGDEILISELEHHSNIVPWQMVREERGAVLKIIPMNDRAELLLDEYARLLSSKTKLVAISHISNSTGTVNPLKQMIAMAHGAGAKVLVDSAQSAPHMPIDVQDLDADFLAFSGHKLYGPTGIGILYGKKELLDALPPHHGGGDMVDTVTFPKTTYNPVPLKFEAGTPMIAEVIGLGAAIDYAQAIGLEHIHAWEQKLLMTATALLKDIPGLRILGTAAEKGAIISFVVEGLHAMDIGTMLDLRGIAVRTGLHCAHPAMNRFGVPASCRASFALYNTSQEVQQFSSHLRDVIAILK